MWSSFFVNQRWSRTEGREGNRGEQLDTNVRPRFTIPDQSPPDPLNIDSLPTFGQYFTSNVFPIRQQTKQNIRSISYLKEATNTRTHQTQAGKCTQEKI